MRKQKVPARPVTPISPPVVPPKTEPVFTGETIETNRRMRFNPLRMLSPENLSMALDQFDTGILNQAAMLWDAMARRDDTISFLKPQLEDSIASKPWGVFAKRGAEPVEASRHKAALEWFYAHMRAVDAFDRNKRGGRHMFIRQMMHSASYGYAVHHFVWDPQPGVMIEVEGAAPVPALTATMEFVPLWYFENTSGTLRFLPMGGFGIRGQELNWDGEWMVTTGDGIMFAASICYVFKRLAFQDWTIFNERYANNKVVGQTNATKDSEPGKAMADIVANFNSDQGIVLYEAQSTDKPPISLLGPEGTTSVDLFERFLDRQDGKMSVMYRGSDRANTAGEKKDNGISAQMEETERLEMAHCQRIADACQQGIDRQVIRYVFGEGVEPLAYFGLPDMDAEDAAQVRASAGFLADRGALVEADEIAERLGVTLTEDPALALQVTGKRQSATGDPEAQEFKTANAARRKAEARLEQHIEAALLRTGNSNPNHDEKGKFAKGHSLSVKGQSKELTREQQKESIDAALAAADRGDQESFSLGRVPESLAARVRSGTQSDVREIGGAELRIDSDFVTHARAYHPNLTDADFHRIPELMNEADSVRPNTTKSGNLPAVEFHKRLGARDHQLIGASLNKKGHFKMTTLKKSAEDQAS